MVQAAVGAFKKHDLPRLERLWTYYRNPLRLVGGAGGSGGGCGGEASGDASRRGRWYRLAQEVGLPVRTTGRAVAGAPIDDRQLERREVVIENDIGWRVQSMVDFMFGKPVRLVSRAADERMRAIIERVLEEVWEASGGIALLQDMALMGHVYGHVDLALRIDPSLLLARKGSDDDAIVQTATSNLRIELIEPRRGVPILDERDYRVMRAYIVHYERPAANSRAEKPSLLERIMQDVRGFADGGGAVDSNGERDRNTITEIIGPRAWAVYENGRLAWEQQLNLTGGRMPVVHIQNIAEPFSFGGQSEVEPLIPLQDELNTRLSDRASRVTLQSFKMYLAKGIHGFEKARVGPGQIWSTDNADASVEAFGGDANSPSEESHIREVREALDKISGIPPLASGVVQAKIGNLSSANALRITLMAVLSKTARKRVTYGGGIERICDLILTALHNAGVLLTTPRDRGVQIQWRDPLPDDMREIMQTAEAKARLGVPRGVLLEELGYVGEGAEMPNGK